MIYTYQTLCFVLVLLALQVVGATAKSHRAHLRHETSFNSSHDSHISHTTQRGLIVGGQPAPLDRYPYFVRLDYNGEFGCGGTLVARDFILTAAHCALPQDIVGGSMTATIGAASQQENDNTTITRTIRAIFRHPIYNINDIALLQVEPIDANVPVIRLNANRTIPIAGDSLITIGLGLTENGGNDATRLQQVELKVVGDALCDERYSGDIHRKAMICAADPNQDSCDGDSGGPLIILGDVPENDIQVGVVSFGAEECAHESIPGVYADVSYVYDWISGVLCEEQSMDSTSIDCTNVSSCRDSTGAFYANWWFQFQRCEWLHDGRYELYCHAESEAWVLCPFTCHSCTYEQDDDFVMASSSDGVVETMSFDNASSQVPMIMVFVLSTIILLLIGSFAVAYYRRRRRNKLEASSSYAVGDLTTSQVVEEAVPTHE